MKNTDHCNLCDNKKTDFNIGVLCGLTDQKPDFVGKCNVIKLDEEFKQKIIEVNIEYEAVLKTKIDTYGLSIIYLVVAFAFFVGGFLIGKYALDSGVISTVPLIIMGVGIAPLGMATGPFNYYQSSLKIARHKKNIVDKVAQLYGYIYDIKIVHLKDSLGNKSYETDLKIRKTTNSF